MISDKFTSNKNPSQSKPKATQNSVENGSAPPNNYESKNGKKSTLSKSQISAPYAQEENTDTPILLPKQSAEERHPSYGGGANAADVNDHQGLTRPVAPPRNATTRAANYSDTKTRL